MGVLIAVLGEKKCSKEENTVLGTLGKVHVLQCNTFQRVFKMIHLTFLSLAFGTVFPALDTTTKLPEAPFPFTWFKRKSVSVLNRVIQNTNNLRGTH